MAVRSLGNRGKAWAYHGHAGNNGIGIAAQIVGLGWTGFTGSKAGDLAWERFDTVCSCDPQLGLYAQASGNAKLKFTLSNPAMAVNQDPQVQASVLWSNELVLSPGVITEIPVLFSAVRIEFVDPGEIYFVAR